jgi:hypothetical protein
VCIGVLIGAPAPIACVCMLGHMVELNPIIELNFDMVSAKQVHVSRRHVSLLNVLTCNKHSHYMMHTDCDSASMQTIGDQTGNGQITYQRIRVVPQDVPCCLESKHA